MNESEVKKLYNALLSKGYSTEDLGDEGTFETKMGDKNSRKELYDWVSSKGNFRIGDYDTYESRLTSSASKPDVQTQVASDSQHGQPSEQASLVPQQRPSLREQVEKPQFPAMEDLPWVKNRGGQNGMLSADDLGDRLKEAYKRGDFESFRHTEEDGRIRKKYTPKKVVNEADIFENAKNKFALTERGQELQNELASIREEKTKKYMDEFMSSDEYKAIASRKPKTQEEADAVNNAVNDLFSQKYEGRIEEEMQPYNDAYRDEILSRNELEIKAELTKLGKKNTSEQVAGLTEEVNALLQKEHEELRRHGGSGNNAMNALMGSTQYNQATGERRKEIGALEAADKLLEESQEIINEAGKKGNINFVSGLGRGLRDNVFELDNWTLGLAEMADAKYLNNALEKAERGEKLTPAEEKLLDASTINMATQAYFSSDLGRGYKAGQVTAESIPFMLEFIANPISGSGNAMAKGLLKYGLKKFGSVATTKGAKIAGRLIGDSAAALGMEGTTGIGRVAAGTLDRMNQNYETKFNDDGEVEVRKTGDMGMGEAFSRSAASTFFENQSEMIFNAFKTGGRRAAKKAISEAAPGMSGRIADKIANFYNKVKNNKTLKSVSDRAQFHGILEEYAEEAYNNMMNVAMGEMSMEDAISVDKNIDTFLGLAPTSLAFSALGIGGLATENVVAKKRLRKFMNGLDEHDRAAFSKFWEEIKTGNDEKAKNAVKSILDDKSLPAQAKKDMIFAVKDMVNVRNTEEMTDGVEDDPIIADATEAYNDGYSEEEPAGMQDTKKLYEHRKGEMAKMLGVEIDAVDEEIGDPVNYLGILPKLGREDQTQAVLDYINAKAAYDGMIQRVRDDIEGRIEQSNAMVDERTNKKTGMLQGVTMKVQDAEHNDRRAYVLDGNLVLLPDGTGIDHEKSDGSIVIRDAETGEMEMVSPDAIFSVEQPVDPETEKQTAAENIRQTFGKEAADKIDGVATFNPGDTYTLTDENGQPSQIQIVANEEGIVDNGDGTVNVTDGVNIFPLAKETIQQQVDAANRARIAQSEQQRQQAMQEVDRPQYAFNDRVTLQDEDGNIIHGQIAEYNDAEDTFVVDVDKAVGDKFSPSLTREQLDSMVVEYNGQPVGKLATPATSIQTPQQQTPQPKAPQASVVTQGSVPADYVPDMELTVLDGGTEKPAMVMGRVREENGTYVPDENGSIVEYYMDGEVKYDPIGKLNGMVVSHKTAEPAAQAGVMTSQDAAIPPETDVQQPAVPAIGRIPKDEQGNPVYEQAETPDLAWDAIVEQTDGDEVMAQTVADGMVADKESALKKLEKAKPRGGVTVAEKIAAEKERKAAIDAASHELDIWKKIAGTSNRRKQEAEAERRRIANEAAEARKAEEEKKRAEREEAERIEREALNGVPDIVHDTPQDARARGYRRVDGHKIDRQEPVQAVLGKEVAVKFSDDITPGGRVAVIDAGQLQPSHIQGMRNPLHFIDEAQPKERNDEASVLSARKIAENIRPEEITSSITAYTGAPTVNMRGEVIQGNNRSSALREMWNSQPEQSAKYKQYLIDHAQEFGLNAEDVIGMQRPVLVNMLDVDDTGAITLGQYTAQDTESGGTERIKPKNVLQRMHNDMRSFANLLLASGDEETSFAGLVDNNGVEVLKWMSQKGYITPTQYKSAFDSKGNLTAEAKNDLRGIMYQSIFKGASTRLEEMFNALPARAQKAILATAFRDYNSPRAERMIEEIQDSIRACYSLSMYKPFVEAKNWKEARMAVEEWKRQYQLDDVSGESYLPSENFSNFALHLATMYKGETQRNIQDTFNKLYDLIQGTQEADLFKQPDNTPRTLAQAIKEVLNIDYNGQQRSNVLGGNITTGQRGKRGSAGDVAAGERAASGEQSADDRGGAEIDSGLSRRDGTQETGSVRQSASLDEEARGQSIRLTSEGSDRLLAQMEEKADVVPNVELTPTAWRDSFGDSGFIDTPMGRVKMGENQITKFFAKGREKEFGMVAPTLSNPDIVIEKTAPEQNAERDTKLLFTKTFIKPDGSRYVHFESVTVLKDGMEVSISSHEASRNALKKEMQNGLILHLNEKLSLSSEWYLTETPAKEGPDLVPTSDNNNILHSRHTTTKQSAETVEASQKAEQNGTQTSSSMDAPTTSSESEDTAPLSEKQEKGEENFDNAGIDEKIAEAEVNVNTNPTEAQKKAGNYKKGHVQVGVFDITIEQPKGSVRSGVDANGNKWETTMQNTYGYIRGTEGVDGDHIDVFLSDDTDGWNGRKVFVVDQYNEDGSFDEHKVMLGFNDADEAETAYLSNYEKGWEKGRKIVVTPVNMEDFEKWIDSSHRKTKPFAEYKGVKKEVASEPGEKKGMSAYEAAVEELGDIEQEWDDRIRDYVAEHYPTQAVVSAKTNSPQGLKEKADMEKDETLKRMRAEAKAAIDAADEKVTALYKEEQEDEKKNSVRDNTMDTGTTSNGSKRNDTATPQNTVSTDKDSKKPGKTSGKKKKAEPISPRILGEAYESGDVARIAETEKAMRDYFESFDGENDKYRLLATYLHSKPLAKADIGESGNKVHSFIAETCKDVLMKKYGVPKQLFGSAKTQEKLAKDEKTDSGILDLLARMDDFEVKNAVIDNPNTSEETLRYFIETYNNNGFDWKAKKALKRRGVKLQRVGENAPVTREEKALRDALVRVLRKMGLETFDDAETGQRVLDWMNGKGEQVSAEKKRALETASVSLDKTSSTAISSADGTKIVKKLDLLSKEYENRNAKQTKTFIGEVADALGIQANGKSSKYATFETKSGRRVTIRLSNHNATVSNFDNKNEVDGISIVVTSSNNNGVLNNGSAHIVEFYYNSMKLRRADGKPLSDIVKSIKQALYSGEYKDTTGLAEVQEVNAETIREHRVFHGSGADFDAFDHSHMGEGEGAQAYGWGSYVTEVEGIGRSYAESYHAAVFKSGFGDFYLNKLQEALRAERSFEEVKRELLEYHKELYQSAKKQPSISRDFISDYEALQRMVKADIPQRHLYTVEIPDDTGSNYLDWSGRIESLIDRGVVTIEEAEARDMASGRDVYEYLAEKLGSDKKASEFLSSLGFTGIKYPAEATTGGRADGAKNYVIFKESDMKITDHVRFFRTKDGEAYGFTVGGKIYLDPRMAKADTPIHEYTHLWADALRQMNPKEWKNIVELMKGTPVWEEVKRAYPELKTDDEIADEVLATYSGQRGAERLREQQRKIAESGASVFEKAEAISVLERVKDALKKFWKNVADFLHIHFTTAEEVADRVLSDLLNGVNPLDYTRADSRLRMQEQAEEQAIIEQAKADGTYMKAPNGKPTNLTEKQWVQVRTKAFKKWFGDWEKAAKANLIGKITPVSLDGERAMSQKEAEAVVGELPVGENKYDGRKVNWVKSSIGKILRHKGFDASLLVPRLKDVFDNSVHILSEDEIQREGHKSHANFKGYHHYAGKISLAGKEYYVRFTIQEVNTHKKDFVPNQLHSAFVSDVEIYSADTRVNTGNTPATANVSTTNVDAKLAKFFEEAKNSSKIVDENGEPLVVYRGADGNYTVFDKGKIREREDGIKGFYFAPPKRRGTLAGYYGDGKTASFFLNIRNPLVSYTDTKISVGDTRGHNGIISLAVGDAPEMKLYDYEKRAVVTEKLERGDIVEIVAFDPNQIKSATDNTGAFSAENDDIRYSRKNDAQDKRDLVAVHNITAEKLAQALELGGFPMPSIAVTKADVGHTTFGDISLVFGKESIDPSDRRNKVYGEDAWTPVFPQVGYKLNEKKTDDIYRRANKAGKLPMFNPSDLHPTNYENRITGLDSKSVADSFENDYGMKQLYLSENGNAVKEYEQREVEKYPADKIGLYEKVLEEIGLERLKKDDSGALSDEIKQLIARHRGIDINKVHPFQISGTIQSAIDYAENGNKRLVSDVEATQKKIDERIDPKKYEAWLEDLFSGIVEKKGIRNAKDPFTPSGNRRKWEELYDRITLDNVVGNMQKQTPKGSAATFGFAPNRIFGASQKEYKSIDEIREAARERIRNTEDSDYEAQRHAILDRLNDISIPGSSDSYAMLEAIQDAVARSNTPKGIHKYLKEFYPKVTMETAEEIADIVKDIQKLSARFFEAKPRRAVGFDEVRLAVVPSDADANLVAELESRGIPVRRYEKGNEDERRQIVEAATDEMDLRFREKGANVGNETDSADDPVSIRKRVEQLSRKLNTDVIINESAESITHPDKRKEKRMRASKGWYDPRTGKIYINVYNNHDAADVAATVMHETVAHKGLRELVGEENYDSFLDEVYKHLKDDLKKEVDDSTGSAFMNDIMQNGGKSRNYEQHRRRQVDELLGRMSEKPFEEFNDGERTLWQKLSQLVRKLLDKFLGTLKLPGWFTLGDNELRYILWRSKEHLERGKEHPMELASDIVKREELKLGEYAARENGRFRGEESGVPKNIREANERFNNELDKWGKGEMGANEYIHAGVPFGVLRGFMPDLPIILRQKVLSKSRKKHDLTSADLINLPSALANPIFVFKSTDNTISVLTELQNNKGESLFVAIELGSNKQMGHEILEVNDILTVHGREAENVVSPIVENGSLVWVDKEKGLRWLSSAKSNSQAIANEVLNSVVKVIENFENPNIEEEKDVSDVLFRDSDETEDIWRDKSMGLQERTTAAAMRLADNHRDDKTLRNDAMRAIGGNLADLRRAMSLQRTFDRTTVKRVADLAKILMSGGYLNGLSQQEVKRLLAAVKNSTGREDIKDSVQKVMDIMVDNQLRNAENTLHALEAIRGSKVDARGVEVQGQLDPQGVSIMKAMKEARKIITGCGGREYDDDGNPTAWRNAIESAHDRISSDDTAVAENGALELQGIELAKQWFDNIAGSKMEETTLRQEIKNAHENTSERDRATDAYRQYIASLEEAIRQNKIERVQAYFDLVGRISDSLRESMANAKAFKEAEKQRVREIQHNANSDMEGRPANEHHKDDWKDKLANNGFVQFLFAPLGTFDQIMRVFGNKSANGEGYLWNRFMRGWVDCRNKELSGVKDKFARLDAKAAEIFGGKVKTWGDIIRMESKLPKASVSFWDGGKMRDHELTQGNLMYIYMVDKMLDGCMKLRKMGITEEDVENIKQVLDPRLMDLADWLQEEFLAETRNEYNETHKRMFGASMAAIEDYFPLKILANARADKPEDLDNQDNGNGISTKTGSIIKRRRNTLALDITGADALSVILDHITQMEHWNAYAEWNRDLNILRTYKRFRNQVVNMTTAYGGGEKLWKKFNDLCRMAAGEYRPPVAELDKSAVNIAKGVTAAKVSFRMFTALKQLLSAPAYAPEVSTRAILKSIVNPYGDFKWCMNNLPIFHERWHSRLSGDPRLLKSDMDWKMWRSRIMELSLRIGMTPNAFVDAVTVSIGARAMYDTRFKQYIKEGYTTDEAEKRAMQDAAILFNQTQQSSESPFLSTMQVDRSWLSVLFTVFRNSAMSYTRQEFDAVRNLKRNLTSGQRAMSIGFMTKQILRDWGIDPEGATDAERDRAEGAAKQRFRRQIRKDVIRLATFGFILEMAWNLSSYLLYIIFGDDDDEKRKMWDDALTHAFFGSVEGLTGGDVLSGFGNMALSGEWNSYQLTKDMPLASDINNIVEDFVRGRNVEGINDIINVVVQSGIGMNPQSITDAVLAIMDACGDDPGLAHESAIFVMRVLQVPQSQIDKMYFDEIGLNGDEASKYTPAQLAGRYARYKVKRGHFFSPWAWDDEERVDKFKARASKTIRERAGQRGDPRVDESYLQYEEVYKDVDARVKAAKKMAKTDYMEAARLMAELQNDPRAFDTYAAFKEMDGTLDKIAGLYLGAKSTEEADLCRRTLSGYKAAMVNVLNATDADARDKAMSELSSLMQDFSKQYTSMQPVR